MAIRKGKDSTTGKTSWLRRIFRVPSFIKRTIMPVLLILLGGLLFNLDRMGNADVALLKYKNFLPGIVRRFLPGGTAAQGSAIPDQVLDGRIIEVYDGDTATLLTKDDLKYKIRFFGIDAPEAAQDFGVKSRDALREKILGQDVTVKVAAVDTYGRSVGRVFRGGRYINLEMAAEGMAWYYADYAKNEYDLAAAQREAQQHSRGLWHTASPQPPWEWRREHKK